MLSAVCDCYSLVKWHKCHKFCFNPKKKASETYWMLIKAFYGDTMSRVQTLNGIHVSHHQTSARGFECSGSPSWSWTGKNVENMLRVGYEECIYFMIATFVAHRIVCDYIWPKDLMQVAAEFVPICWKVTRYNWKMTRYKTNLLCSRAYKNRPKRKDTSI